LATSDKQQVTGDLNAACREVAERYLTRYHETMDRLERSVPANGELAPEPRLLEGFRREMDDDFNTPRALALIFDEIRSLNRRLDEDKREGLGPRVLALKVIGETLGLLQDSPGAFLQRKKERWILSRGIAPDAVEELIKKRERARSAKQWREADRIRAELQEKGVFVRISSNSLVENHPHEVFITKEAPNYRISSD